MKKTEHPAWQTACRKLCKFMGILMNAESVLKSAGFATLAVGSGRP